MAKGMVKVSLFIVLNYTLSCFTTTDGWEASYIDIRLRNDFAVADAALTTYLRHLWYLGMDLVAMSLLST